MNFCMIVYINFIMEVFDPQQSTLRCPTCNMEFADIQTLKDHYRSDLHRYNLKRKMVKLPPVTLEQFQQKIHNNPRQKEQKFVCGQCGKVFASAATLEQHAKSKGHNIHMQRPARQPQAIPKQQPFVKNSKKCLFSGFESASLEENLNYMMKQYSFFIPSRDYCIDVQGLIEYLQEKIEVGHMCISCENKGAHDFQSAAAVRSHMIDRGHTFMNTQNGFEEYEKYYDFSSLFQQKLKEQSLVVPGIQYQTVKVWIDDKQKQTQNDDDQWQQQSDDEEEWQSEDEQEQQTKMEGQKQGGKRKIKTYRIMKPTLTSNDELLLPNGKTLGHRKYRYLYRQNVRVQPWYSTLKQIGFSQPSSALVDPNQWSRIMQAQQKKWRQLVARDRKMALKVGINNNGLMRHFRCQNPL